MEIFNRNTIFIILLTIGSFLNYFTNTLANSAYTSEDPIQNDAWTEDGDEYLIITFNEPGFTEKLTELANFRIEQGISTKLITTTEIGGSTVDDIKNYIIEAYTTWDIPPNAILLVGDHDKIPSPSFQGNKNEKTDISDNYYADVDGDDIPELTIARLPINDLFNLTNYINRLLEYETSPPAYTSYYDHPVTSMSWTDDSDIMFNAEVLNGFFSSELDKEPLRENAIILGTPGNSWFVNQELINYFGPNGLNYIPGTPEYLIDWEGNAESINTNLNNGAFLILNIDHGTELGWSSPEYWISNIQGINSADPFFVISINNLNGKFNWSSDCFAEGLINHQYGAAGVIASTTNLNDYISSEYYFALIDALWDNFIPDQNSGNSIYPFTLPAFANTMAKYHLAASGLPYIESTIYGFHYFGEPFTPIYYNYPEPLDVVHDETFEAGIQTFDITANVGSTICLSSNKKILSVEEGTGNPVSLQVQNLSCEDTLIITITKQNFIRYMDEVVCNLTSIIKNNNSSEAFSLFPNPAENYVRIVYHEPTNKPASISLYNNSGKLIYKEVNISFPHLLDRKDLPPGIYYLQLKLDENLLENVKLIFK